MDDTVFSVEEPFDLRLTLGPLDPLGRGVSSRLTATEAGLGMRTPHGPAGVHATVSSGLITARAWGPGATWALSSLPDLFGVRDDPAAFRPGPGLVRRLHRQFAGMRIGRTGRVFDHLVATVLSQKVSGREARRAYVGLLSAYGEPAPGSLDLAVPPGPDRLTEVAYEGFHPLGIERRRAEVIRSAARRAARIEETVAMTPAAAATRLTALAGIGAWSAAEICGVALGDADAVPIGDYHLPSLVSWALAGEERATDERMLELLEPFRGDRLRVLRLLEAAGLWAPRRGPRRPVRSIAGI